VLNQPAQPLIAPKFPHWFCLALWRLLLSIWDGHVAQSLVRPVSVLIAHVLGHDVIEVACAQKPRNDSDTPASRELDGLKIHKKALAQQLFPAAKRG
jgi:hypothetical protein